MCVSVFMSAFVLCTISMSGAVVHKGSYTEDLILEHEGISKHLPSRDVVG